MNEDEMGWDGGDLNIDCNFFIVIMKRKEIFGLLELFFFMVGVLF